MPFLLATPQRGFIVLTAIEHAKDDNGIARNRERDRDAPLETDGAQSRPNLVAPRPALRKVLKPQAVREDTIEIGCCSGLAGPSDKKIEEMVELPLRSRSEDHTHNNSTTSVGARLVTSLDPLRDSAAVGHVGGIGLVFLVGRDDLLLQPSIEGVITIPQRPEALADDVAFARVLAALHLGLYHLRHVLREGDAQRTAGRHGRVSQRALLARSFP